MSPQSHVLQKTRRVSDAGTPRDNLVQLQAPMETRRNPPMRTVNL